MRQPQSSLAGEEGPTFLGSGVLCTLKPGAAVAGVPPAVLFLALHRSTWAVTANFHVPESEVQGT